MGLLIMAWLCPCPWNINYILSIYLGIELYLLLLFKWNALHSSQHLIRKTVYVNGIILTRRCWKVVSYHIPKYLIRRFYLF